MSNKVLTYSGLSYYHGKITQEFNKKQNTLVSGTNIKTINGQSLLGSGNLTIGGGSGTVFYEHTIEIDLPNTELYIRLISPRNTAYTFNNLLDDLAGSALVIQAYGYQDEMILVYAGINDGYGKLHVIKLSQIYGEGIVHYWYDSTQATIVDDDFDVYPYY